MSEHNLSEVIRHLKADMQVRAAENSRFEFLVLDILAWLLCEGVHNRQFKITDIHIYFNELENDNPENHDDLEYLTSLIAGHFDLGKR